MKLVDRKNRNVEDGDIVAFDIPVFYGTEQTKNKMWDIFWGKACDKGIMVDFCPITQKNNVLYKYPEDSSELLIIRKHVHMTGQPPDEVEEPELILERKPEEELGGDSPES